MNDTTSSARRNSLLRRTIKKTVIGLYCRGWLPFRVVQAVFHHIDLKGV